MSKSPGQEPAPGVTSENPEVGGTKARPKITFINPSEFFDIDRNPSENPPTAPNVDLYSRLLGRQVKAAQVQESVLSTENVDTKPRKRRQREKNNKQKHKKRSVDPKFPWLESDDEVDCALPLDDESDDDAFLQRLVEEKEREEAEEERRKQEAARLRQLKAAQRRARFTGRIGRPRGSSMISRVYIPPIDEHPSSRPSETSDDERVSSVNTGEDDPLDLDDAERLSAQRLELDEIPTHSAENEDSEMGSSVALQSSDEHSDLFAATMDPVTLRHCAPCLTLPPSSTDLLCPTEYLLDVLSIYECLRRYSRLLRLSPFRLEDFLSALAANENSALLAEVHIALLKALVQEDEANGTQLCAPDCKDVLSLTFAFLLDRYTWPHILAAYLLSIKKGEPAALASVERLASLSASAATAAGGNPYGGPSCGGGADVVLTAALFEEDLIPLDQAYPFVDIRQRVGILRGLVGLFLATGPVRGDMLNEGFTAHDDFCRVCRQSGEVLCCDTCPAVFHLICLTPPLEAVPSSSWNCPICQAELAAYGEPAIPKSGGHHRTVPIGTDRAGRVYWHVANRIVVEPVDFRQKEPCLPGLLEGVWEDWETAEATAEPVDSEDRCTPHVAYANEPKAYYYSGPADINALRQCLSAQWEPLLCLRLDQLIPTVTGKTTDQLATEFAKSELKSEESTVATLPHLPRGRSILGPSQAVAKPELLAARTPPVAWPPPPVLPPPVDREALEAWLLSASFSELPPMERTFIFEVANGILIHNQDGIFSEFSHSPEDYKNRFKETAPSLVFPPHLVDPSTYESISAAYPHWRGYTNLHSTGLLVPNKAAADSDAQECRVNIILNRLQQHDERERRRLLSNKFSLSDASLGAWAWLEPANVAAMLDRLMDHADNESEEEEVEQEMAETEAGKNKKTKAVTIESLEARARTKQCAAIAVGPKRYLHVLRLTLCYLEAQLPAASLSPAWRLWRQDWHRAVLAADSVAQLADLMSRLETAVRSVAFQRTWSGSLGPLCLERFTAVQREEDKRVRLLERSTGPTGGGNNNHIVRTKTPRPIRHTVWKTRGEEYRRLGGDGWIWLSVTRRRAAMKVRLPLTAAGHASRGPLHGIGWGVCPEYIQNETPIPAEEDISATAVGFHPITGVPLSKNWTRVRYLIPTEALKRLNTEREVAKKGDLTTPTDGVEPDKFEKCVEGEPPKPEPMEVQAEVPQEATVRSPAASGEPPLPPKVEIPSTETDLTSSSTMQVVDEESKMEEDDQQVDEKKQKLKKEIEKPEDADPLVFDVSQGLRERIHFPPVASTRACTDGRKRLCLDDLLTLRRQVAVEAEKVSAEAETGLRELRAQRDKLKAQLAELQARVQTLADQVQNARTEHARAVKAKQTAQAQLSGQSGVYASSMSTTHFDLPFGMSASDSRYQTMSRGRSGGRRQRGRRPGRPPGRLPKMRDPESESKSSTDTDGGTGTHGDDGSSSPAAGGGGGGASTTENSQGLRRSARAQKAPRLDPDFVVDFDDEEADEDDEVDEAEDENAGGSNYEAREADIRFSSLPLLHLDSGGHQQGERAPQSGVQRVILPRLSQLDGADDSSAEEEEEAAAATSAIKQGALQKPAQPCSVILTKVPVTNLTSGARPMPSSGLIVSAPLTPGVTKTGQPLIKLQNIGKPLTPITLAQSNLNGISASQAPAVTSTASVDGAPGSQQPVRLVRVLRAPAGSPSGAQLIQTVDAKQPSGGW
uniref:Nucleosome-remodeling factor subunit NURF301 n=1 Tax=Schistocephalus solidus TaxID=70667 RepID=A0A0X3PX07_SCHSO